MRMLLVAVGTRMPAWIEEGFSEFARRMPRELPLHLIEIKPEPRPGGKPLAAILAAEEARIVAALPSRPYLVALDERGSDLTTRQFADRLSSWMSRGEDVVFVIGGPDGLSPAIKQQAREMVRLSSLTLPHALVRVMLAEQVYRAVSLLRNHPYHRE